MRKSLYIAGNHPSSGIEFEVDACGALSIFLQDGYDYHGSSVTIPDAAEALMAIQDWIEQLND